MQVTRMNPTQINHGPVGRVRELHTPVKRWQDAPDSSWSWDTEEEARAEMESDTDPVSFFEVCSHCAELEMEHAADFADYRESLWPCPTMRALDGAAVAEPEPRTLDLMLGLGPDTEPGRKLRADLEAIRDAERRAWVAARDVWLG